MKLDREFEKKKLKMNISCVRQVLIFCFRRNRNSPLLISE